MTTSIRSMIINHTNQQIITDNIYLVTKQTPLTNHGQEPTQISRLYYSKPNIELNLECWN